MFSFPKKEERIKKKEKKFFFFLLCSLFSVLSSNAQCAMCRAALESDGNTIQAESVNDGIVYLMIIPYLLVAAAAYAIYKLKFAKKK
jgi:hypothetical protein